MLTKENDLSRSSVSTEMKFRMLGSCAWIMDLFYQQSALDCVFTAIIQTNTFDEKVQVHARCLWFAPKTNERWAEWHRIYYGYLLFLSFSFSVSLSLVYFGIPITLPATSDSILVASKGCISLWDWFCSRWRGNNVGFTRLPKDKSVWYGKLKISSR